jgi:hypothetical protein
VKELIAGIAEQDWVTVADYPETGEAQVAEVPFKSWRLIVRRTRLGDSQQFALWPDWRHHAFATNRTVPTLTLTSIIAITRRSSRSSAI